MRIAAIITVFLFACAGAFAKSGISYADATALGLVEGFTEFLPVSSTGHLLIANEFLELNSEEPLLDSKSKEIIDDSGASFTLRRAAEAYAIVIQIGAILAVALIYKAEILQILAGILGRNPSGLKLAINILVAFMPAAILGLLFDKHIEEHLFGVKPIIVALAAGAFLMFIMQKIYDKRIACDGKFSTISAMTPRQALLIGLLQCVAMWPGTSRSMMTILGGYAAGLKPADAAKFSFLLGLVTLSAASFYKAAQNGPAMLESISPMPLLAGIAVAYVSAAISVKWLVGFLTRHGLAPFAWYRLFLAALLAAMLYFNFI